MEARLAAVYFCDDLAGWLREDATGYHFAYSPDYLALPSAQPVSLTLPLREAPYHERYLFPFFDGLIPEGWLLELATRNWKLNPRDRMGLLLVCCADCIGAVRIEAYPPTNNPTPTE
jgi:serine/threonine-protein kinase HipA